MIIRCPGCQKRYDIAQHIVAQKKHYKLRCANCGTSWRLSAPSVEPKSIEPNSTRVLPPNEPKKQLLPPKTYSTWHDLIKQYSLDWIILLAAVAIAVLLIVYEGKYIRDLIHMPHFFAATSVALPLEKNPESLSTKAKNVGVSAELGVENVAFSTIEQKGNLRFVVKGEIVNQSSVTVASPDLTIIAWGECPLDSDDPRRQSPSNKNAPRHQRCILTQWVHPMSGQLISAGKRQLFQTFAPTQGSIKAKEVEITGYTQTNATFEVRGTTKGED